LPQVPSCPYLAQVGCHTSLVGSDQGFVSPAKARQIQIFPCLLQELASLFFLWREFSPRFYLLFGSKRNLFI
jgi:hypothetical protein